MSAPLVFHPAIAAAREAGQPIVALESTLITHGLPYPANVETALAMEAAVRAEGATPATIAVIHGEIRVGLDKSDIEFLASLGPEQVRKCSRRDLPIAVGLRQHGATTVAGTMIVAQQAGIEVFATGGIGGVHRGHPFDVSADLIELGRTPVTVICAGAKSILDLPLTLETLETQGVPVIGYSTSELPAFYSRTSGLPVSVRIDSVAEIAAIIQARRDLNLAQGMLVTVPVPESAALPVDEAEAAITEATRLADTAGVAGKDVTPFVLSKVKDLTGGRSMQANVALLLNNASIGAKIAVALAALRHS